LKGLNAALLARSTRQAAEFSAAQIAANALTDPDEKSKALAAAPLLQESAAATALRDELSKVLQVGISKYIFDKYLIASVPKFLYFDEYYQMTGQLNIEQLKQRQATNTLADSDRPMLGLIELARLNLDQLLATDRTEQLFNKLEGTSNHLSRQVTARAIFGKRFCNSTAFSTFSATSCSSKKRTRRSKTAAEDTAGSQRRR
jgi:hypothetical protein